MTARAKTNFLARRPFRGGGFSLIELIAVMVVAGVLGGVAVVSLTATTSNRSTMAAKQLARDLTFARQRAVATGTRSWVTFDTAAETWTILAEDPSNPGKVNAAVIIDPATGAEFVQRLGIDQFVGVQVVSAAFDGSGDIGFDWLGRPLNDTEAPLAAQGSVVLTGSHTITADVGTGHIAYVAP